MASSDTMIYASLKNGKLVSYSDWSTSVKSTEPFVGGLLDTPSALALTATDFIIAERYRLDTVSLTNGALTPALGTGSSGGGDGPSGAFTRIGAIALTPGTTSKLWIADYDNFRRADISSSNKTLTTVYQGSFGTPRGVTETPSHDVYVTALAKGGRLAGTYRFRETQPPSPITTVSADMTSPSAITSDATVVVVGDEHLGRVYVVDPTSIAPTIKLLAGGNGGVEHDDACFFAVIEQPTVLALDSHHDVLLADATSGSLRKIERYLGVLDITWTPPRAPIELITK